MIVLCVETSCDETAAAIISGGRKVLSSVVASQIDVHSRYGGVVPELASRKHLETLPAVVREALDRAGLKLRDIEGIAVTRGPGLIGALLVGVSMAKALGFSLQVPLVGLHHMEGHVLAILLEVEVDFPFLALAVSGGHTHLYRVDGIGRYTTVGRTLDDAAGEAFDKVAKMLGLGYPGGARIDQLAAMGDPEAIKFPRPLLHKPGFDFSFSGIKTAMLNHLENIGGPPGDQEQLSDIAAGFQEAVVEVLVRKTVRAAEETGLKRVVVSGGVACNRGLRKAFAAAGKEAGLNVFFPSPGLCSDNAAMLGVAGEHYLAAGRTHGLDLNARASWEMDRAGDE